MKKILIFTILFVLFASIVSANVCNFGDTDGNCVPTGRDITAMKNSINFKSSSFSCDKLQADVDGSGALDINDVTQIQNWINYKDFNFNGKPTSISITSGSFDVNNVYDDSFYNLVILVTDADGTPRPCIGIDSITTDAGSLSISNGLTDVNGKLNVQLTIGDIGSNPIPSSIVIFMQGSESKTINDITQTVNFNIKPKDADNDGYNVIGYPGGNDCNDNNNLINPGAVETLGNGIDENCNGVDMKITGTVLASPYNYNLYNTKVDLYVNGDISQTVYTGDFDAPLGYYEFYSDVPGNAYVNFEKPGFVTSQTNFVMNVNTVTYDKTLSQDNAIAGALTGTLYDLSMVPQAGDMLLIKNSVGTIQIVQSDENGIYNVVGLPGTSISGEVYDVRHGGICIIYGGDAIPIVPGVTRTQDLYIDCNIA